MEIGRKREIECQLEVQYLKWNFQKERGEEGRQF